VGVNGGTCRTRLGVRVAARVLTFVLFVSGVVALEPVVEIRPAGASVDGPIASIEMMCGGSGHIHGEYFYGMPIASIFNAHEFGVTWITWAWVPTGATLSASGSGHSNGDGNFYYGVQEIGNGATLAKFANGNPLGNYSEPWPAPWTVNPGQWTNSSTARYVEVYSFLGHRNDATHVDWDIDITVSSVLNEPACQSAPVGGPYTTAETFGGGLCGGPNVQPSVAAPVNVGTGNFWHSFSDLVVPGRGQPLEISRTYNSLDATNAGWFGSGWSSSYEMSLAVNGSTAVVKQGNGSRTTFTQQGDGTWLAPPRAVSTLVDNGDGTWIFNCHGMDVVTFDSQGRLTSKQDLNGYTTTIAYSAGQAVVTDPAGRTLTFTFTGARVTSVADSASPPRTLTYSYSGSDLTDVVDAGDGHWQFTYDGSHRMLTMRSPRFYGDTTTTPTPVTTNHYDAYGRVDWQTDPLGRLTTLEYATSWTTVPRSTIVTDPKGNRVQYSYAYGMLTREVRGYGTPQAATWQYFYDPVSTAMTTTIDPNNHTWLATYDDNGNQESTTDPLGRTTSATYNSLNLPLSQTDGKNVTTTMTYDEAGNLLTRSTPWVEGPPNTSKTTTYHYDDVAHLGDVTSMTDPDGQLWVYTYDTAGNLTTQADPLGNTARFCYDAVGRRTAEISALGTSSGVTCSTTAPAAHTTYFTFDAAGDLLTSTDPLGHQNVWTYDADRNLKTSKDPDGNQTSYTYDAAEQRTQIDRADTTTLKTAYWPDGTLKSQTDGANQTTSYAYDALAHLTTVTDPLNRVTNYAVDAVGNPLSKQDPGGNCAAVPEAGCTTFGYDAANQQTSITYSDGVTPNVTNIGYDDNGRRTTMTDGTGTSSWSWDSLGRMTSSTTGAGATVGYGYDLRDNPTSIVYPGASGTVTRGYDDAGRLTSVTDWLSNTTTFSYDADSFLTTQAYPNTTTTTFTPDGANRLMDITAKKGSTTFASFTYTRDDANQVMSVASTGVPSDNHSYSYNQLNQLKTQDSSNFSYDAADNPTKLLNGTTQAFDAANQLTGTPSDITFVGSTTAGNNSTNSLTLNLPAGTTAGDQVILAVTLEKQKTVTTPAGYTIVSTTNSGTANNSTKLIVYRHTTQPGDTSVALTFNTTSTKSAVLAAYRGVDANNPVDAISSAGLEGTKTVQVPSVTTTANGTRLVNLAGEINTAGTWTAPNGMTSRAVASGGTSRTLVADEPITTAGATGTRTDTFSVNAKLVGALVALRPTVTTYTYDPRGNRLTTQAPDGAAVTLGYDQANRLTSYGTTASYAYNGDGLRQSKTVSGTTTQETWDISGELPLLITDGTTNYIYGPGGMPIEQVAGTTTLYYHQDQLGSTRALTDNTGAAVATYTYDPYGRRTGSTGTISTPLGFAGQYTDQESGFQYLRARYYDPTTAQFLTRDPLGAVTGTPYAYAANNPVNLVDPTGDIPIILAGFIGGALFGGASDIGMQMLTNAIRGCDPFDINWRSVATSAFIGGVAGGATAGIGKALGATRATNTATRIGDDLVGVGDDVFTHGYSYSPRIRARAVQDPVGHNFPYSYDDVILKSTPVTQADGSLLYRIPGSINSKDGFFEIAVNPSTQTIFHRTFVGG